MPISDCEVRDPRIRRTRQLLQGALMQLLGSKPFDDISVQDITDAATVNRATFYDHYVDKFALLEALIAGGFHKMLHERSVFYDGTCPSAAGAIVLAACDYLTDLRAAQGGCQERRSNVAALEDGAMIAAIRRVLADGMAKHTSVPEERRAMQSAAASWAIYGAVKEWLTMADRPPADAIVPEIVRMVTPLLGSPLQGSPLAEHQAAEHQTAEHQAAELTTPAR
ncbi:MAG TPA: TetR family transcriptional regulator [Acidobacteriaceae bacterium]|nr:TetR family transcriptional regulator [Acidobacteriaceae bacterium]